MQTTFPLTSELPRHEDGTAHILSGSCPLAKEEPTAHIHSFKGPRKFVGNVATDGKFLFPGFSVQRKASHYPSHHKTRNVVKVKQRQNSMNKKKWRNMTCDNDYAGFGRGWRLADRLFVIEFTIFHSCTAVPRPSECDDQSVPSLPENFQRHSTISGRPWVERKREGVRWRLWCIKLAAQKGRKLLFYEHICLSPTTYTGDMQGSIGRELCSITDFSSRAPVPGALRY